METSMFNAWSLALLLLLLGAATVTDVRSSRIPNGVSLGGIGLGLLLQTVAGGTDGLLLALGGTGLGIALLLPFYLLRGMGAGDVKLMGTVGAFLGPAGVLWSTAATMIVGGVMAAAVLVSKGGVRALLQRYAAMLAGIMALKRFSYIAPARDEAAGTRFPYALAIASGTVMSIWATG